MFILTNILVLNIMNISKIQEKEFFPGLNGRLIHGQNITWAFWNVKNGSTVPLHSHIHEQIMFVVEGEFKLTIDGIEKIYEKDDYVILPPNVPHEGIALSDCKLMDVFSPAREDYK